MIIIENLTVGYKKHEHVIDSLNLKIEENTINGVVGLNGAGKTTLFNTLFGLKKAKHGSCLFRNQAITKNNIAFLPTENYFFSNITGSEYLSLFKNATFDTEKWNELFKLPLNQVIEGYSTGMRKKLALLGIIKQDKPVILLDEPFNGLDVEMSRILHLIILRLKEIGKTIILSSHIVETLTNLCDSIHYLENGKIKYSCSKDEFSQFEKDIFDLIEKDTTELIDNLLDYETNDE